MTLLPAFPIALIVLLAPGHLQDSRVSESAGVGFLKHALVEDRLSHDRKLPKSDREAHAKAFHLELNRAFNQLMMEAHSGDIESMYRIGAYSRMFAKEGLTTQKECLPWIEQAALKGHPEAPFEYALIMLDEDSIDKAKGFEWLKRSTQMGQRKGEAAVHLVRYYSYGSKELGIKRNPAIAWTWAEKGAKAFGMDVAEFLIVNGLQNPDKIKPSFVQFE